MMMLCLGGSGQYQIYKRVSGIYTLVQNSAGAQYTNNTTQNISITTSGDTVTLKQSGTTVLTRTDAAMPFKTATGVGFRLSGATNTPRWDNVVVL
jgi:hypothetical protein